MTNHISTIIQILFMIAATICFYYIAKAIQPHCFPHLKPADENETELPSATTYYIPIHELHPFLDFVRISRCDGNVMTATPEELANYWKAYCKEKNNNTSLYPNQEEPVL